MSLMDTTEKLRRDRVLLEQLIDNPSQLGPDLQPVRRLADDELVGYKATGRGQSGTDLDSTLALLESAQASGLVERLDWAFRCLAFDVAATAGLDVDVYITPEPETYGSACPPRLATAFGRGRREVRVAAEIPRGALLRPDVDRALAEFRGWGWKIVLDDVADEIAADAGTLRRMDLIRPDVIKLDLARSGRPGGPGVDAMLSWARDNGCEVMAIAVESDTRRAVAVAAGAATGRGRALGMPGPLPT